MSYNYITHVYQGENRQISKVLTYTHFDGCIVSTEFSIEFRKQKVLLQTCPQQMETKKVDVLKKGLDN